MNRTLKQAVLLHLLAIQTYLEAEKDKEFTLSESQLEELLANNKQIKDRIAETLV